VFNRFRLQVTEVLPRLGATLSLDKVDNGGYLY
jgi:hypothetical protein